jgi:uncharacterized protein YjbI with pentapeptide repeats
MESRTQRAQRVIKEAQAVNPQRPSLRESVFDYADLHGLDLSSFDLRYCSFHSCDLRGTKLPERLRGAGAPDFTASRRDPGDPPVPGWKLLSGVYLISETAEIQDADNGDSWPFAPDCSD